MKASSVTEMSIVLVGVTCICQFHLDARPYGYQHFVVMRPKSVNDYATQRIQQQDLDSRDDSIL
jgi:hypothetical protein